MITGYKIELEHGYKPVRVMKITWNETGDAMLSQHEMTAADLAKEYVDTLYLKPNAWGQCVHPHFGVSHKLMILMSDLFGTLPAQEAISLELARRKP